MVESADFMTSLYGEPFDEPGSSGLTMALAAQGDIPLCPVAPVRRKPAAFYCYSRFQGYSVEAAIQ